MHGSISKGLSRKSRFSVGGGREGTKVIGKSLGVVARTKQRQDLAKKYQEDLDALSWRERKAMMDLDGNSGWVDQQMSNSDSEGVLNNLVVSSQDSAAVDVPEDRTVIHDIEEMLNARFGNSTRGRHYVDHRPKSLKLQRSEAAWERQMEDLTIALMEYRLKSSETIILPSDETGIDIPVINIVTRETVRRINFERHASPAVAMVYAGYMATTPLNPQYGISIDTLFFYHRLRLRKPSFSVQAFSKFVCDIYSIPYKRNYRDMISRCFELYVRLDNAINAKIEKAANMDGENWRVNNACPPCTYKLKDEPPLIYERIVAMDGNNSLKRCDRKAADTRVFGDNDYYIPTEEVNRFANEIPAKTVAQKGETAPPEGGDVTDGDLDDSLTGCATKWKAASADSVKKMWALFDETGVFASACRHGLMLWVVDMVKSGELAKYPLATLNRMLETLGERVLIGFDIGCSFNATIRKSSLSSRFWAHQFRCCTNAFHGYAHNYPCQVQHHPNAIEGAGLEDMETMERIFSGSNEIARLTRYSSSYQRRLWIIMYYKQWDADKYMNLGKMLVDNYRQAKKIIQTEKAPLEEALQDREISEEDIKRFMDEEKKYMKELKGGRQRIDFRAVTYVEHLEKLKSAQDDYDKDKDTHLRTLSKYVFVDESQPKEYSAAAAATLREETRRKKAKKVLEEVEQEVQELELALGIPLQHRWKYTDNEYQEAKQHISMTAYHAAVDKLELLICQRLFELQRLNISQTGYNMRTQIREALKRRSVAVQKAVKEYNDAALAFGRPQIDWDKVSHYEWLQDFVLLRETDSDVLKRDWADPVVRYTMKQYLRVQRAHEEIYRCDIEIRRLHTSIVDENSQRERALEVVRSTESPAFTLQFANFVTARRKVNDKIMNDIRKLYRDARAEYSGNKVPGIRLGSEEMERVDTLDEEQMVVIQSDEEEWDEDIGKNDKESEREKVSDDISRELFDEDEDGLDGIIQYMSEVTL